MATTTNPRRRVAQPHGGPPSMLEDIVGHDDQGVGITAGEAIIAGIRRGQYVEIAVAAAGVEVTTYKEWVRRGVEANAKKASGVGRLTVKERAYAQFANDILTAEPCAEVDALDRIIGLAAGGHETVATTTTYSLIDGVEVVTAKTVKTETAPPNLAAQMWHAERRWPARWNRRQQLEVSGQDGGPIRVESPRDQLLRDLGAMQHRMTEKTDDGTG